MNDDEIARLLPTLKDVERERILATVRLLGGNKVRAARSLGISLKGLYLKLNRYRHEAEAYQDGR